MKTEFAVYTIRGKRKNNQDNYYLNGLIRQLHTENNFEHMQCTSSSQYFAVCDGLGGEQYGEVASYIAVKTLDELRKDGVIEDWSEYIRRTNDKLCDFQKESQIVSGTTFAGLYLGLNECSVANIGDSRVYHIRNNEIKQLTRDHTEFQMLLDAGLLSKEDFHKTSAHNHLTQHLGIKASEMEIEPHVISFDQLQAGDQFLLCSDGLYGVLEDTEMLEIIQCGCELSECCRTLVETAEKKGSKDNITALTIRILDIKNKNVLWNGIRMLFQR